MTSAGAFSKRIYEQGQVLLREGVIEKLVLFAIVSGEVSFVRKSRFSVRGNDEWDERCWKMLGGGDVFCSVGMLGIAVGEPCSAIVTSEICECYIIIGES